MNKNLLIGLIIMIIVVMPLWWFYYNQNLENINNRWEVQFVHDVAKLKTNVTTCWRTASETWDTSTIYNFGSEVQIMQNCNYRIESKTYDSLIKREVIYHQYIYGDYCFANRSAWLNESDPMLKVSITPLGTQIQWLFEKPSDKTIMLVDDISKLNCTDLSVAWSSTGKRDIPEDFRNVWFKHLVSRPKQIPILYNVSVLSCNGTHLLIKNVGDRLLNENADLKLVITSSSGGQLKEAGILLVEGLNILPGVTKWVPVSDELSTGRSAKYMIFDDEYPPIEFTCQ